MFGRALSLSSHVILKKKRAGVREDNVGLSGLAMNWAWFRFNEPGLGLNLIGLFGLRTQFCVHGPTRRLFLEKYFLQKIFQKLKNSEKLYFPLKN